MSSAFTPLQLGPKYLKYWLTASNGKGHGIHSPFIFEFVTQVLRDRVSYPASIEELRKSLLDERRAVPTLDFGAGNSGERLISEIARTSLKPAKFGQLLYRMARFYQPANILELGTSLGVTTAYLASGALPAGSTPGGGPPVITLEGAPSVAAIARRNFSELGLKNIRIVEGNFDATLPGVLESLPKLDLVFIDGNHRLEPTLCYYREMQPKLHSDSILIFDDIHWSREMEAAWEELKQDNAVRCSVDLFYIGILFFRVGFHTAQHFTIRF
jgi:predicted O-methyltransferase YrrM